MLVRDAGELAALMRERRRKAGWSQTELGERIGASRSWVSETEKGKPTAEIGLVLRALDALGLLVEVRERDAPLPDPARERTAWIMRERIAELAPAPEGAPGRPVRPALTIGGKPISAARYGRPKPPRGLRDGG